MAGYCDGNVDAVYLSGVFGESGASPSGMLEESGEKCLFDAEMPGYSGVYAGAYSYSSLG